MLPIWGLSLNKASILVGNLSFAFAQFLQVAWISKFYGPVELGMFAIATAIFAPLVTFLSVGQRYYMLTRTKVDPNRAANHLVLRLVTIGFLLSIYAGYAFFIGAWEVVLIAVTVGVFRLVDSILEFKSWCCQYDEDWRGYLKASATRSAPIIAACALGLVVKINFLDYLLLVVIISILMLAFALNGNKPDSCEFDFEEGVSFGKAKEALTWILPVGAAAGIESFLIILPRYFIAHFGAIEQTAIYLLTTQVAIMLGIGASAKLQADMPVLSRSVTNGKPGVVVQRIFQAMLSLMVFMIVSAIVLSNLPDDFIEFSLGEWAVVNKGLFFYTPLLAWVWYASGYLGNVASMVVGKTFLSYLSLLQLIFVIVGLLCLGVWAEMSAANTLILLAMSFLVKMVLSSTILTRRLVLGKSECL